MAKFDFIIDEELRKSLESDYLELNKSIEAGNFKSAVVMAGSIIEAMLIDYLVSVEYEKKAKVKLLEEHLPKLIEFSRAEGLIADEEVNLLVAIKDYRNLIHPGRSLRLAKVVDADTATIAKGVVGKIAKIAEESQRNRYGFTAEQLLQKIIGDSSAHVMIDGLVEKTSPSELKKLLVSAIPGKYLEVESVSYMPPADLNAGSFGNMVNAFLIPRAQDAIDKMIRLEKFHHLVLEKMTLKAKSEVLNTYAEKIKTLDESGVERIIKIFFRAEYLEYVDPATRAMLLPRILEMFKVGTDTKLLLATKKILKYLTQKEMKKLVNGLFEQVLANNLNSNLEEFKNYIFDLGAYVSGEAFDNYVKALSEWVEVLKKKKPHWGEMLQQIVFDYNSGNIPF